MKFTPEQIEQIRQRVGGTTDHAENVMQSVARMCAEAILAKIEDKSDDREFRQHSEIGMSEAASLLKVS